MSISTKHSGSVKPKQILTSEKFMEMCEDHTQGLCVSLKDVELISSEISDYNLKYSKYNDSDIKHCNFIETQFNRSRFEFCNLQYTKFIHCDLRAAFFGHCNLSNVNFEYSILHNCIIEKCNLKNVSLQYTSLMHTSFIDCDLRNVKFPSPFELLKLEWGTLSDELTAILMAADCYYAGNIAKFNQWGNVGFPCPFMGNPFQRIINFDERRGLWNPDLVKQKFNLNDILRRLFKEKNCKVNF